MATYPHIFYRKFLPDKEWLRVQDVIGIWMSILIRRLSRFLRSGEICNLLSYIYLVVITRE